MSINGRDPWGGPLEIAADSAPDDDRSRNLQDYDRAALSRPLDETQQSWLLGPGEQKKKKYVDLGCIIVSRKIFVWTVGTILPAALLAGFITLIVKRVPPPTAAGQALNKALMLFNAQRSGRLPKNSNVSWKGNSCLNDGKSDSSTLFKDLTGGYYDAGDAIKFNFPQSFAMTMLSWSVIEYSAKYEAAGELNHVKEIIKWGTDYFFTTFNQTADTIDRVVARVGKGTPQVGPSPMITTVGCVQRTSIMKGLLQNATVARILLLRWQLLWLRHLLSSRTTRPIHRSLSMVPRLSLNFRGNSVEGTVWAMRRPCFIIRRVIGTSLFATWLYYAMSNSSYLQLATTPGLAKHASAFWGGPFYGVLSWDNKLAGTQVLLSRLRLFLSPGYPYEEILTTFHNQTSIFMCSFLPYYTSFNRTRGGMIQLNHGAPQPLQYVVTRPSWLRCSATT